MIYGIGTDICDIRRMAATYARRGERFPERVLGPAELKVFRARQSRAPAQDLPEPHAAERPAASVEKDPPGIAPPRFSPARAGRRRIKPR